MSKIEVEAGTGGERTFRKEIAKKKLKNLKNEMIEFNEMVLFNGEPYWIVEAQFNKVMQLARAARQS